MKIGDRAIAPAGEPYIIAELGVNHDGSPDRALDLAGAFAGAGADALKLQLFEADRLMSRASSLASYQKDAGERDPLEMLRRLELSVDRMAPIVDLAHARGVHAIVTVFSLELVEPAERLPWDAYKTASPDIINKPLLQALAATGKPLILSTGAATLLEVGRALTWLKDARERIAVLQCVSSYPTPIESAELGGIAAIADIFPGPVGYSDHTREIETGPLAVARGACILEKHATLNKAAPGPDHAASLEPAEFAQYVRRSREAWRELDAQRRYGSPTTLGRLPAIDAVKRVTPIEEDVRRVSRQSLVATRDLLAGHVITREDLTIKRPGTGIEPWRLEEILGARVIAPVERDTPITVDAITDTRK